MFSSSSFSTRRMLPFVSVLRDGLDDVQGTLTKGSILLVGIEMSQA